MNDRKQNGFTLIELVIAMSISAILLGIAAPSFIDAVKNAKLGASYGDIVSSLYLARSEATKRRGRISICARSSDTACGSSWSNGWIIFTDTSVGANAGTVGTIDGSDEILRVYEPLDNMDLVVTATPRSTTPSASNSNSVDYIQYRPDGSTSWSTGTFMLCDDRDETNARTTNVTLTGGIRKGRKSSDEAPIDVNGVSLVCP